MIQFSIVMYCSQHNIQAEVTMFLFIEYYLFYHASLSIISRLPPSSLLVPFPSSLFLSVGDGVKAMPIDPSRQCMLLVLTLVLYGCEHKSDGQEGRRK